MSRLFSTVLPVGLLMAAVAGIGYMGFGVVRITGDSMRPVMRVGDVVVYRSGLSVGVGDVIVCGRDETTRVVHRVVGVDADGSIHTRGDANTIMDREPLRASEVEGRVVFTLPTGWPVRVDLHRRGAKLLTQIERWL